MTCYLCFVAPFLPSASSLEVFFRQDLTIDNRPKWKSATGRGLLGQVEHSAWAWAMVVLPKVPGGHGSGWGLPAGQYEPRGQGPPVLSVGWAVGLPPVQ